jgi:2,3-bisphosphoglycerate-independent phosphoglycerate mutase
MVGHTGVFPAIVKAVETVDQCLKDLSSYLAEKGYDMVVIADHGNADYALNEDGTPNTAHSTNPVPIVLLNKSLAIQNGILADVAPTLLQLLGVEQPKEMTGNSLIT